MKLKTKHSVTTNPNRARNLKSLIRNDFTFNFITYFLLKTIASSRVDSVTRGISFGHGLVSRIHHGVHAKLGNVARPAEKSKRKAGCISKESQALLQCPQKQEKMS